MSELQTIQTGVLHPKPIRGSAKVIYEILCKHVEDKTVLGLQEICNAYADYNIPANKVTKVGMYGATGKWEIKQVNSRQWYKDHYVINSTYRGMAIQWLKYHIGNLVLNGHAILIPVINLEVGDQKEIQ